MENKIEQLEKYIEVREQEIEELQERIDKAIEYIEKYKTEDYCDGMSAKQLLDILRGKE